MINSHPLRLRLADADLPLSSIDLLDTAFRITTETEIESLLVSLREIGLINLPIVFDRGNGYQIISGFRRINACVKLGLNQIPVRVAPAGTSGLKLAQYAITDNVQQRMLNLIETAHAFALLNLYLPNNTEIMETAARLGIPASAELIQKLLTISRFDSTIKNGFASGILPLSLVPELSSLDEETRMSVAEIFINLKPSLNKQREILTNMEEIARREHIKLYDLIQSPAVQNILSEPDQDRSQKMHTLRLYLKQRRYPTISGVEEKVQARLKKITAGSSIEIKPPSYLEGSEFFLCFKFNTSEELSQRISRLKDIESHQDMTALINKEDLLCL